MTNLLRFALCTSLAACAIDGDGDATLADVEQGLNGAGDLTFDIGYGDGYLSPVPETRTGVVDGVYGWADTIKTANDGKNSYRRGDLYLYWEGYVPALQTGTGTCTLHSNNLMVSGATHVIGHNPFPYTGGTDAKSEVSLTVTGYVHGTKRYEQYWTIGSDSTKSENRTKYFDKDFYLQSGPAFAATSGDYVQVIAHLHNDTWTNSEGYASAWTTVFGFPANSNADNVVQLVCP